MNSLTGYVDTDLEIINHLNLNEFRLFCKTNLYNKNFCENNLILHNKFQYIKNKINKILSLMETRKNGIVILPSNEEDTVKTYYILAKQININDLYPDEEPLNDVINRIAYAIRIFKTTEINKKHGIYTILIDIRDTLEDYLPYDYQVLYASKQQLIEFLTQLYYNQLIIDF